MAFPELYFFEPEALLLFTDDAVEIQTENFTFLRELIELDRQEFKVEQDLAKEFCVTDLNKCLKSTKLDFALNQFVNAFYEYERLEKKYPELMKIM